MNVCSFEYMFIIIEERMFVNKKCEQIFGTFVCFLMGFMIKFIWYILSKYRIEKRGTTLIDIKNEMTGGI